MPVFSEEGRQGSKSTKVIFIPGEYISLLSAKMNAFERDLKNCLSINCGSVIPVYLSEKKIVDVKEAESEGAQIKYTLFATVMLRRACCGRGFRIVVKFWAQLFLIQ
jgi:hypothetical protein